MNHLNRSYGLKVMAKTVKMSIYEDWMRQASTDAPRISQAAVIRIGCATHPLMRHASKEVSSHVALTVEVADLYWMRHASSGCATHRRKPKAEISLQDKIDWMRHASSGCATHPKFRISDYKTDRGQFLCISLPIFHSAPIFQTSSRSLIPPFSTL